MSSSLPKNIKFSYSSSDVDQREHTPPSSHKRKKIFTVQQSSKQFSPFQNIESKLQKIEIRDEIHLTIQKITEKLEKAKTLEFENEVLRKENARIKEENRELIEHSRQERVQNNEQLRSKVQKAKEIMIKIRESSLFKNNKELQDLYDILYS